MERDLEGLGQGGLFRSSFLLDVFASLWFGIWVAV